MKRLPILLLLCFMLACTTKQSEPAEGFKTLVSDTAITHRPNMEVDFSNGQSELLHLPYISKGVDSFELRIWSLGLWTRTDLFILRFTRDSWIASNYIYYANGNLIDSLHLFTKEVPNDKAMLIQNYFLQDSILHLPSQIAIPNFKNYTLDGESFYIEIATNKFYKHLRYHNPKFFTDPYNIQFVRLLEFIQSHISIYFPY